MRQIISFKKELPFKTKVTEITSISLERDIKVEEIGIITGVFHVTGDYKMNEGSISREDFSFDLPFDITLDPRYDVNTVETDIEDFYYDIINDDTLKVNIDLFIEAEYLKEEIEEHEEEEQENIEEQPKEEPKELLEIVEKELANEPAEVTEEERTNPAEDTEEKPTITNIPNDEKEEIIDKKTISEEILEREEFNPDLFSNLDNSETYSTYYVYIVKEEDNIDRILNKYGITKEELEDYNDISDVKVGDKLIIPKCNEK